ncbi:glycoside hydrolase family 25 protein [Longispora sp. NPDC051575]|uniref:glycoside hydrolase family 25 protein n=1 Tax=Longispora sp. NPDC051575 TaxID=3154943 RepID=UPI0034160452
MFTVLLTLVLAVGRIASPVEQYPVDGVDIASWQHPWGAAIDWPRVREAGVDFATVKATEGSPVDGTAYVNPWFRPDFDGARAAGLPVAPYHFYLGRTAGTGTAQAAFFVSELRDAGYSGHGPLELPPILDLEWDWKARSCPAYATVDDALDWLRAVGEAFGRPPIVYTNRYFVTDCLAGATALGGYPLQVAQYRNSEPTELPDGWSDWLLWQWTARDEVPGIPADRVTRSVFKGSQAELDALANLVPGG